ncbi:thiosulfate oxidation carrier complex protein SoxZ [Pseudothauera nasutitermitis]|uniref:Thiosulfate oxidation carrier complex protein SoxZ n=1 Tax=Pseudothauera nasutitermitis TaxID=2565930 RepID=A0A4S4ARB3_9RHOO|nr:thiosulfate oxidation carrier complex protein SoxZ [Pseudothauera nasutitermitis]THF62285.1 thiosulfate oxidation carrier complex protein SoxZ [Pseudothauera nasutitermitis]
MSNEIRIRAMVRNGAGEIRVLMPHPMESGLRRGPSGDLIPAHYIRDLLVEHNGKVIVRGQLGPAVSPNPLFAFYLDSAKAGDRVKVSWTDNQGQQASQEAAFG